MKLLYVSNRNIVSRYNPSRFINNGYKSTRRKSETIHIAVTHNNNNINNNNNNNNNNNHKTSIVQISSKRIELRGGPRTGDRRTHSPGTMQSSSTNDQMEWKSKKDN